MPYGENSDFLSGIQEKSLGCSMISWCKDIRLYSLPKGRAMKNQSRICDRPLGVTLVAGLLCTRGSGHNLYTPLLANAGGGFFVFWWAACEGWKKRPPSNRTTRGWPMGAAGHSGPRRHSAPHHLLNSANPMPTKKRSRSSAVFFEK